MYHFILDYNSRISIRIFARHILIEPERNSTCYLLNGLMTSQLYRISCQQSSLKYRIDLLLKMNYIKFHDKLLIKNLQICERYSCRKSL